MTTSGPRDVQRMLGSYTRAVWETWARARGLDPQRSRGPALQTELARVLLAPAQLKAALAQATADEQMVLARVKLEGGKIPGVELKAQAIEDGVSDPDAVITSLMARGLLFYDRAYEGYNRWELWGSGQMAFTPLLWLPSEVGELVAVPADLGRLSLQAAPTPAEIREASFTTLQRDLYLLIQAVRENPVKLLKSGEVGKRESERLLQILPKAGAGENDPTAAARASGDWFHFLWLLIQRAELVQIEAGRVVASEAGLQFLGLSEEQQAHRLIRAWVNLSEWSEFYRVPSLEFEDAGFGDLPAPQQLVLARLALIELLLRERPYPGWYSVRSLLASMRKFRVAFLIPRSDARGFVVWGFAGGKGDRKYHGFHAAGGSARRLFDKDKDWDQVEGAFLRTLLAEPLVWLGIVRLGYVKDELVSFEFTERGAAAVGLVEMPAARPPSTPEVPPGQRALVVQPNFEMVVYPEVAGISLLVELDRFAERVRMDRAALYRLTREHLCRGLQAGLSLDEITRTLEKYNDGPLPQNVAYSLQEWERLFNRIHVYRAVSLLEAADEAELRALRTRPELKEARELAPGVLLLPPGVSARGLRGKPEVIDYQAPIVDAIEFETTTRLRVLRPTPRLLHRLLQIAGPVDANNHGGTETGRGKGKGKAVPEGTGSSPSSSSSVSPCLRGNSDHFQLSQEKIAETARRWKWEEILTFLTQAARGKVPAETAVLLKGWAGALAPATVTSLTLLAAASAEWLDEVMRLPEVRRFIMHRLSPTMALVAEENRKKLEAALAAAGVATEAEVRLPALLAAEARAAAEAGDTLLVGPPRKRRTLIERALAEGKRLSIATLPYGGKLAQTEVEPVRIEGEGASARLVAHLKGMKYEQSYALNQIQGVRMLDEPSQS